MRLVDLGVWAQSNAEIQKSKIKSPLPSDVTLFPFAAAAAVADLRKLSQPLTRILSP